MTLELRIPDALATAAHRAAVELGMSRSELFARAVAAFLRSGHDAVHTEQAGPVGQDPVWTDGWEPQQR
jgi:hypothetical protein